MTFQRSLYDICHQTDNINNNKRFLFNKVESCSCCFDNDKQNSIFLDQGTFKNLKNFLVSGIFTIKMMVLSKISSRNVYGSKGENPQPLMR